MERKTGVSAGEAGGAVPCIDISSRHQAFVAGSCGTRRGSESAPSDPLRESVVVLPNGLRPLPVERSSTPGLRETSGARAHYGNTGFPFRCYSRSASGVLNRNLPPSARGPARKLPYHDHAAIAGAPVDKDIEDENVIRLPARLERRVSESWNSWSVLLPIQSVCSDRATTGQLRAGAGSWCFWGALDRLGGDLTPDPEPASLQGAPVQKAPACRECSAMLISDVQIPTGNEETAEDRTAEGCRRSTLDRESSGAAKRGLAAPASSPNGAPPSQLRAPGVALGGGGGDADFGSLLAPSDRGSEWGTAGGARGMSAAFTLRSIAYTWGSRAELTQVLCEREAAG
jgi:hypothetical protein